MLEACWRLNAPRVKPSERGSASGSNLRQKKSGFPEGLAKLACAKRTPTRSLMPS